MVNDLHPALTPRYRRDDDSKREQRHRGKQHIG